MFATVPCRVPTAGPKSSHPISKCVSDSQDGESQHTPTRRWRRVTEARRREGGETKGRGRVFSRLNREDNNGRLPRERLDRPLIVQTRRSAGSTCVPPSLAVWPPFMLSNDRPMPGMSQGTTSARNSQQKFPTWLSLRQEMKLLRGTKYLGHGLQLSLPLQSRHVSLHEHFDRSLLSGLQLFAVQRSEALRKPASARTRNKGCRHKVAKMRLASRKVATLHVV